MSTERDANRIVRSWLEDGPTDLPDHIFDAVLADIPTTSQRRLWWPAWRISTLDTRLRIAVAAAAVLVIAVIGYQFLPKQGGVGGEPTPSPSPSPTAEPSLTATPLPTSPPLSQTFDSTFNGISISYPAGWTAQAATEAATSPNAFWLEPHGDTLYDPGRPQAVRDHLFLSLVSVDVGISTPAEWLAENVALQCASSEAVTIDGVAGAICSDFPVALVSTGSRGYVIWLYTSGEEPLLTTVYDRAWFETVLATVQLRPEDAINPSPAPS